MMNNSTFTPEDVLSMIAGKLLGDGCITKQERRKPRFQFIHTIRDKEWCFYCYEKLSNVLPLSPPHYKKIMDHRIQIGYTECYQVQSRTDPLITWLESIWYHNRKKVVPFVFLEKYLNELALAWWYQDDGHLSQKDHILKKIILSTDNFTTAENRKLIGQLSEKFNLFFKLDSQNRLILYDQLQIHYFLRLVQPYMHESMKRKIPPFKKSNVKSKRTTIYLPNNIHLTKPTTEINRQLSKLNTLNAIVLNRTKYIEFYKNNICNSLLKKESNGYQIVIHEPYCSLLQSIKDQTGMTLSQIITICLILNF